MYDTLMQMGRWFGYRPGYLDLCRLYTSPDLVKWFAHIADASEELWPVRVKSSCWLGLRCPPAIPRLVGKPAKLQGNVDRDRRAAEKLAEMNWRVLNVWECSTRDPAAAEGVPDALRAWINSGAATGEISAQSQTTQRRA